MSSDGFWRMSASDVCDGRYGGPASVYFHPEQGPCFCCRVCGKSCRQVIGSMRPESAELPLRPQLRRGENTTNLPTTTIIEGFGYVARETSSARQERLSELEATCRPCQPQAGNALVRSHLAFACFTRRTLRRGSRRRPRGISAFGTVGWMADRHRICRVHPWLSKPGAAKRIP